MPRWITCVLFVISLLSLVTSIGAQTASAPDFTLPIVGPNGLTGQTATLSSFRGRVVLLEFMEPWCPHCQNIAPTLEQLHNKYGDRVVFISVAGPWQGAIADDTASFITKYGSTWTYVYDSSGTVMNKMYGVQSTPTFFIIGKDGSIVSSCNQGESCAPQLDADLAQYTSTTITTVAGESSQLLLESYSWPTGGPLSVTLQNGGSTPIDLVDSDYFVNGVKSTITTTCTSVTPGGSCQVTVTLMAASLISGVAYLFKVVTPTGGVFTYTVIYGGSGTAQIQPPSFQNPLTAQNASFVVPPRYDYYFLVDLNSGDTLAFSFSVSSWRGADDISFTVVSSTRAVPLNAGRVSQYSGNYNAVLPGRYYLRFDNSYSILTTKTISLTYSVILPTIGIETYEWDGNMITGYLRNYGNEVDTKNAQVSLNGVVLSGLGGTCGQTTLKTGWSCSFSIKVPNATWVQGSPYVLNLVTPTGNFAFPVVASGNSASVIETQPNLITFQTVNTETIAYQTESSTNPGFFSRDFFVNNAFAMVGALAGGVLLLGAILGLVAVSIAQRNTGKGLYGEDENRGADRRRNVPLLVIIGLGAFGLLMVSVLTPRLTFSFELLFSRLPYLVAGVLVLILVVSSLSALWIFTSILRARRKGLRNIASEEGEMVLQEASQRDEIPIQQQQIKKRCHYCGAEVPSKDSICGKCGMPAMYRK